MHAFMALCVSSDPIMRTHGKCAKFINPDPCELAHNPGNFWPCLTADIKVEKCLTADIKFKQVPDKPFPVDMSWLCYLIVI
jgi:hypothetical protein